MNERNYSKYTLAICHLFHPILHGFTENSDQTIIGHYLVFMEINNSQYFNNNYKREIQRLKRFYDIVILDDHPHPLIRNYHTIKNSDNYIKLDIIQSCIRPGLEEVACFKTFWLKIFQRKWKKIFNERKKKIKKLSNPKNLMKREMNGK